MKVYLIDDYKKETVATYELTTHPPKNISIFIPNLWQFTITVENDRVTFCTSRPNDRVHWLVGCIWPWVNEYYGFDEPEPKTIVGQICRVRKREL